MAQSPDQIAAAWAQGMNAAGAKIADGVNAVTVSPGRAAAAQADVWAQNVAASKPKWQRNVGNVTVEDWRNAMITKGVPRIGQGATAAQPQFAAFMAKLIPFVESARASLPPRGTLEQNIARSNAFIRKMATFQK